MTVSKIRLPDNTEHDIRAKYLIQSSSSDATSAEFSARTVTEDAIANIQKIYGNTVVVSDTLTSNSATAIVTTGKNLFDIDTVLANKTGITKTTDGWSGTSANFADIGHIWENTTGYTGRICVYMKATANTASGNFRPQFHYTNGSSSSGPSISGTSVDAYVLSTEGWIVDYIFFNYGSSRTNIIEKLSISIANESYDGTYEPYQTHRIDLNIPTLTGKLNGAGSSVVIFPDGMGEVNTIVDELIATKATKRTATVDLGALTWDSGSSNTWRVALPNVSDDNNGRNFLCPKFVAVYKTLGNLADGEGRILSDGYAYFKDSSYSSAEAIQTAMNGVNLIYTLATTQEYTLDNTLQLQYPVVAGGTEMVLPTSGTAPMKMDVIYGNAADAAANMSQNFISVDSMKEFLAALGTQMGGTWSMGYENGKHTFTFTSN